MKYEVVEIGGGFGVVLVDWDMIPPHLVDEPEGLEDWAYQTSLDLPLPKGEWLEMCVYRRRGLQEVQRG